MSTLASAIHGLAFSLSRTTAASRNNSDERPLTPPIASTSSCDNCLRPLMTALVIRKPTEFARALRVSLSAVVSSSTWPPLTMPRPALPSNTIMVAATPTRFGRWRSSKTNTTCELFSRSCRRRARARFIFARRSRSSTAAPMAAALRSAWGLSDLSDRTRRPSPSIARALQNVARKRCGIRLAERQGSRAHHAPPALTFGFPGKQTVK